MALERSELAGCDSAVDDSPLAVDLCCGRGGWTRGLAAAGFQVVGVDLLPQDAYPVGGRVSFVQADIRTLRAHELRLDRRVQLVVASPPCQGFSTMRAGSQEPPRAEAYELVAHALRLIVELRPVWWAVENVRGAWKWWAPLLGDPDRKAGPYYLWGHLPDRFRPPGRYPSKLRYRDPGRRSEIPGALSGALASAVLVEAGLSPPPESQNHCELDGGGSAGAVQLALGVATAVPAAGLLPTSPESP